MPGIIHASGGWKGGNGGPWGQGPRNTGGGGGSAPPDLEELCGAARTGFGVSFRAVVGVADGASARYR